MARRPVKIKRYRNVGQRYRRRGPLVSILLFLLVAAIIFVIGWFGASRCIDAVTGFWYEHFSVSHSDSESDSTSVSQSVSVSQSESVSQPEPPPPAPPADAAGTWGEVALSAFGSEDTLRSALKNLAAAGVDHAVVTLKDERGYIYYNSAVELAATAGAVRSDVDVNMFVQLCGEYGLAPCARLYAFKDPLAAYADRSAAVQFQREGVLWLDSSQELGGKPWLNPYSLTARQYLLDIAAELDAAGVEDVVFAAVQFPSAYALEVCYYGEGSDAITRTECLRENVALLQSTLDAAGQRAWFEWPTAAAVDKMAQAGETAAEPPAEDLVYGDGVAAYGALRVLLIPTVGRSADGMPVLPVCDAAAVAAFAAAAAESGTQRLGLDLQVLSTDAALADAWYTAAADAGFTHFKN